ncbi:MAG TPA: SDR family oxidoreductase [Amycolatopsis sp.]|nr:SDR family oxidoreductase [Amycolatopsis sp.]
MPFQIDLAGRRALVTGAGQGVGRSVAGHLARAGAHVLVNDVVEARAAEVVAEIRADGGEAGMMCFDVTDRDAVAEAVRAAGRVDILVNNAGNAGADGWKSNVPFAETAPADWEPFLKVNLLGPMHTTHSVLPAMTAQGWGRIITIVSDAGRVGEPRLAAYGAAKAGAAGFARSVAREVGRFGVTVNNVSLGSMNTPATAGRGADHPALKRYAIRRFGEPEDAAGMVVYLASDLAEWVTGQTFAVNGGYSMTL